MKSIRLKVWLGMMSLVAIVLSLLWLSQIVFLEKFYMNIKTNEVKDESYAILQGLYGEENRGFQEQLDTFTYNENLSLEILNLKGELIYSSGARVGKSGHMPMMNNNTRRQVLGQVLLGEEVMEPMTHMRFGNRIMLIGLPIEENHGELVGALLINMPIEPVEATISILKRQLIIITIILLLVSLIISSFIANTLTRPIRDITKALRHMTAGDFSIRIKSKSKDEIGTLSQNFNLMGEELSRIDKLRKELIGNISHDLRTPLSLIRGYAETIKDVTGDNTIKRNKQLDVIIEESQRLDKMVDDVLSLSQIESGYINLSIEEFNLEKMVERIARRFEILCEKNDIKLERQVHKDTWALGDESRLEQVLYNLLNNAFDHSKRGDRISILAHDEDKTIRIEIKDTGSGIPKEDIKNIWDRYYKTDKVKNHGNKGQGLGLAIVKGILEAHHIPFGVQSKEGQGTTFWFRLNKSF